MDSSTEVTDKRGINVKVRISYNLLLVRMGHSPFPLSSSLSMEGPILHIRMLLPSSFTRAILLLPTRAPAHPVLGSLQQRNFMEGKLMLLHGGLFEKTLPFGSAPSPALLTGSTPSLGILPL